MTQRRAGPARALGAVLLMGLGLLTAASPARADKIKNGAAVFSGLDKITGRIISFEAAIDETVQFGSLKVTARVCYTRPPTEAPQTTTFVEVDEVSAGKPDKRIFSGWMYAASPGLHGIEHPIYDIWLTSCKKPGETIVDTPQTAEVEDPGAQPPATAAPGIAAKPAAPKPRRAPRPVVAAAPRPVAPEVAREPTQRFFPTSQYPSDLGFHDPSGHSAH